MDFQTNQSSDDVPEEKGPEVKPIDLFNSLVAKLAVHIPFIAKGLVENALKNIGATPQTATPRQIKKVLDEYILPKISTLKDAKQQTEIMGGGFIQTDQENRIISITRGLRSYLKANGQYASDDQTVFDELYGIGLIKKMQDFSDISGEFITRKIKILQPQKSVLEVTSTLIRDPLKKPAGSMSVIRDITLSECMIEEVSGLYEKLELLKIRLEERSEQLTKSESKFRNLSTSLPVGVMLLEENNTILFANTEWARIFDHSTEDFRTITWEEFVRQEDCPGVLAPLKEAMQSRRTIDLEFRITTPKTPLRWVHLRSCPLFLDESAQTVQILQDIDERKKNEQDLKQSHVQLIHSEKLASIGQLAAGVAHEINNPVGFVMSNSDTMDRYMKRIHEILDLYAAGGLAEQVAEQRKKLKIDYILEDMGNLYKENHEGLERIVAIIKNLKDFSRIDTTEETGQTDINVCLKNSLTIANNEIKYHADVTADFGTIDTVSCNAGEINQVFLNILVNAAQAIKEQARNDRGNIAVRTWQDEQSVFCEIADDGPGMPESVRNRVFEPFFTTKEVGKGTGLGLSISYDIIVNRHKGLISIDSEVGKGTRFLIKLPKDRMESEIRETVPVTGNKE
jgi:PAS domain S-box-containing protein